VHNFDTILHDENVVGQSVLLCTCLVDNKLLEIISFFGYFILQICKFKICKSYKIVNKIDI
jgi:hypothetical protein